MENLESYNILQVPISTKRVELDRQSQSSR